MFGYNIHVQGRTVYKHFVSVLVSNNSCITEYKILSPRSTLADNYRYLCGKYKYSYNDWYSKDVNSMLNKICVEYTNHDYAICQTVLKLCNMRDGVSHCEYLNSDEICKLLSSICTD